MDDLLYEKLEPSWLDGVTEDDSEWPDGMTLWDYMESNARIMSY